MENDKQAYKISPKTGRGLGNVTPIIFGSTVGYPSDSLASCVLVLIATVRLLILETMNDWTLALKNKNGVTGIDYSKAFDTVCHSKLAAKLAATGITGNLLKWLKDFLNCRTQVTRV